MRAAGHAREQVAHESVLVTVARALRHSTQVPPRFGFVTKSADDRNVGHGLRGCSACTVSANVKVCRRKFLSKETRWFLRATYIPAPNTDDPGPGQLFDDM